MSIKHLLLLCIFHASLQCYAQSSIPDTGAIYTVNKHVWQGKVPPLKRIPTRDIKSTVVLDKSRFAIPRWGKERVWVDIRVDSAKYMKMIICSTFVTPIPRRYRTAAVHGRHNGVGSTVGIDSLQVIAKFDRRHIVIDGKKYKIYDIPIAFDSDVVFYCRDNGTMMRVDLDYAREKKDPGWYHVRFSSEGGTWFWDMRPQTKSIWRRILFFLS